VGASVNPSSNRLMLAGSNVLLHSALAVLTSCADEMMAMDSLGSLLPFLQRIPVPKVERNAFQKAYDTISKRTFTGLLRGAERKLKDGEIAAAAAAVAAASANPRSSVKRTRHPSDENTAQFSSPLAKKVRRAASSFSLTGGGGGGGGGASAAGAADAVPPTPSVFRRIMDSLATPLRARARLDGAQTPKPRVRGGGSSGESTSESVAAAAAGLFAPTPTAQRGVGSAARRRRTPRHAISAYDASPLHRPASSAAVFSPVYAPRSETATAVPPSPGAASASDVSWLVVDPNSPFGRSGECHLLMHQLPPPPPTLLPRRTEYSSVTRSLEALRFVLYVHSYFNHCA
jgi:hypothetical protein